MISLESLIGIVEFFLLPLLFGVIFYFLISKISRAELNCVSPTPAIEKYDRTEYIPEKLIFPLSYFLVSTIGIPSILSVYFGLKFGIRALLPYIVFGSIFISFITNYISLFVSVKNEGKDLISILRKYAGERAGKIFFIFGIINLLALFSVLLEIISEIFVQYPQVLYPVAISLLLYTILGIIRQTSQLFLGISILTSILVYVFCFFIGQVIYRNIPYADRILNKEIIQITIALYILGISLLPYWGGTKIKSTSHFISLITIISVGCIVSIKNILNTPQIFTEKILEPITLYQSDVFPSIFVLAISASWGGFNSLVLSSIISKRIRSYCNIPTISFLGSIAGMFFAIAVIITTISLESLFKQPSAEKFTLSFIPALFESFPQNLRYKVIEEFLAYSFISFTILSQETIGRSLRLILKESLSSGNEKKKDKKSSKWNINFIKTETFTLLISAAFFLIEREKIDKIWIIFGTSGYLVLLLSSITSYVFLRKEKFSLFIRTLKLFSVLLFIFSSIVIFSFLMAGIKNHEGLSVLFPAITLILILYVISVIVRVIRVKES
jgi:carbon starvation protein CstA